MKYHTSHTHGSTLEKVAVLTKGYTYTYNYVDDEILTALRCDTIRTAMHNSPHNAPSQQ